MEEQDNQLSHLAVAIEQFLQSATIGEFDKRLRLLSTFQHHVQAEVHQWKASKIQFFSI